MSRDTKQRLLQQGLTSFKTKGFNHTGIQEVLQAVGVPKGSFYHYFKSKDDFGKQVVTFYAEEMMRITLAIFEDTQCTPLERFRAFFAQGQERMSESGYSGGCFLGNMCQEMGDISVDFESLLENSMCALRKVFIQCIGNAQACGEVDRDANAENLADFMINSWQGALLRMKVAKSPAPLETFREIVFSHVLTNKLQHA